MECVRALLRGASPGTVRHFNSPMLQLHLYANQQGKPRLMPCYLDGTGGPRARLDRPEAPLAVHRAGERRGEDEARATQCVMVWCSTRHCCLFVHAQLLAEVLAWGASIPVKEEVGRLGISLVCTHVDAVQDVSR